MNLQDRLNEIIATRGVKQWTHFAQKDQSFYEEVLRVTQDITEATFAERVLIACGHDLYCSRGERKKYDSITKGFKFCGRTGQCVCASEQVSQKCKKVDHTQRLAKTKETLLARYGTTNPGQTPSAKQAHQAFYADPEKVKQAVEKGRQTMQDQYGVDNAFKLAIIDRKKIARRNWSQETEEIIDSPSQLEAFLRDKSVETASRLLGIEVSTLNGYIRKYGIRFDFGSSYENEIAAFLKDNDLDFISRSRSLISPRELDFYLPEYKLAIEFNGLYYHSDEIVDPKLHEDKQKACEDKGIRLLMINEDEWIERKDIIQNKVLILCGKGRRGVGARKLTVAKCSASLAMDFCQQHHLQGAPSGVIAAYAAYRDENIVAVITLSRQRKTNHLELSRYCTDGKLYAGVFTKLLKVIRKEHDEEIVSFADLRYSDGDLYRRAGFLEVDRVRRDYRYFKRKKTFHKSNFTKKRIEKQFGICMDGLTEREAMKSLGYARIYDCGKLKFVLR